MMSMRILSASQHSRTSLILAQAVQPLMVARMLTCRPQGSTISDICTVMCIKKNTDLLPQRYIGHAQCCMELAAQSLLCSIQNAPPKSARSGGSRRSSVQLLSRRCNRLTACHHGFLEATRTGKFQILQRSSNCRTFSPIYCCYWPKRFRQDIAYPQIIQRYIIYGLSIVDIALYKKYFILTGKSNLMDAISFVLGERTQNLRVRTLRVSLFNNIPQLF